MPHVVAANGIHIANPEESETGCEPEVGGFLPDFKNPFDKPQEK